MPTCASCGKWARWDSIQLERIPGYMSIALRFCGENCLFIWLSDRAESREKARIHDDKINLNVIQI